MDVLIVGCGYLGRRAAAKWLAGGHRVSALTRSATKADALRSSGIVPIIGNVLDPLTVAALPAAEVLLIALTHDPASGVSKSALLVDGVANLVQSARSRVRHVIHVSSTSVYGQSDGSWIDETSPTEPTTDGGQIALAAERKLQECCVALPNGCQSTVLRLAGIYGPGRLIARVDQLRAGAPVAGSPDAWLNLIHVEDAATCVCAAAAGSHTEPVLLICDDRPVTRGEFYSAIAREVGAPPPTFDPDSTAGRRTTGLNKRCRNARMHAELGVALRYPDSIAALPDVIRASPTT
ncbi:MAG: SDR family oxidoreductase [Planctomycetaceae bacterium]